ncbi:MAG: hypothetical protein ACSHWY_05590 [Octadecabacter sp.]
MKQSCSLAAISMAILPLGAIAAPTLEAQIHEEELRTPLEGSADFTFCGHLYFLAEVQFDGAADGALALPFMEKRRLAWQIAAEIEASPNFEGHDRLEHITMTRTGRQYAEHIAIGFAEERDTHFQRPLDGMYSTAFLACDTLLEITK